MCGRRITRSLPARAADQAQVQSQVLVKVSDLNRRRVVNAAVQSVASSPPTPTQSNSDGTHQQQSATQHIPAKQPLNGVARPLKTSSSGARPTYRALVKP